MKKIIWVTDYCFLDTDVSVVPYLAISFNITWLILGRSNELIEAKKMIENSGGFSMNIDYIERKKRIRNPKVILEYYDLFRKIKKCKADWYYFAFLGKPYFFPLFAYFLPLNRVVLAMHNVSTPKGAENYYLSKVYTTFVLFLFKNIHVFSLSQLAVLKSISKSKNILYTPMAIKNFGQSNLTPGNLISFLNFGYIRDYKRIDVLIDAAQNAYERTKQLFLVKIAGNCADWSKYEKMIKYDFLFDLRIENIPNEDIPNLFASSHYFVLPYQDIAQSGSMTIGLNYNLPTIVSDLPALREYMIDKETGFVFNRADSADLSNVMVYILENHSQIYNNLKNNQKKMVESNLSINSIVDKYRCYFLALK